MQKKQFRLINTEKGVLNIGSENLQELKGGLSTKCYMAQLTSSSTTLSVSQLFDNTRLELQWSRVSTGLYRLAINTILDPSQIDVFINQSNINPFVKNFVTTSVNTSGSTTFVFVYSGVWNSEEPFGELADNVLQNSCIRIEIYKTGLSDGNIYRILNQGKGIVDLEADDLQTVYNGLLDNYFQLTGTLLQTSTNVPLLYVNKNCIPFNFNVTYEGVGTYKLIADIEGDLTDNLAVFLGNGVQTFTNYLLALYAVQLNLVTNRTEILIETKQSIASPSNLNGVLFYSAIKILYFPDEV